MDRTRWIRGVAREPLTQKFRLDVTFVGAYSEQFLDMSHESLPPPRTQSGEGWTSFGGAKTLSAIIASGMCLGFGVWVLGLQ